MDSLRQNTFYLDIRGIRNLKHSQIYDFIADELQLTPLEVLAIQVDLTEGKVFVELSNQQKVQEVIEKFDDKLEITCDGKSHTIRILVEDGGIDVKLHHLPPKMPEDWIRYHLQRFGSIIRISNEKCKTSRFPDTLSGVRIARMQLRRAIPSYISIRGYNTYVTYNDQVQTCRHCSNVMHRGRGCAENRAFLAEQERDIRSYADIAAGKQTPLNDHTVHTSKQSNITQTPTGSATITKSSNNNQPKSNTSGIVEKTLKPGPGLHTSTERKASSVLTTGTAGLPPRTREKSASRATDGRSAKRVIIEADISDDDDIMAEDEASEEMESRTLTRAQASSQSREASRTNPPLSK